MTPEQGKVLFKVFTETMKMESEITTKVLRAVPEDKKSYKPDPKTKSAHELAWHLAQSEVWFLDLLLSGKLEWVEPPAAPPTISAILDWYRTNYQDRFSKLEKMPAEHFVTDVPFFAGEAKVPLITYANFMNLHSSHHRGQLSTYLRPMGSKIPSIYGGSADEPFQG